MSQYLYLFFHICYVYTYKMHLSISIVAEIHFKMGHQQHTAVSELHVVQKM